MRARDLIIAARVISMIFTPFYLPLVGMLILFLFSYLSLLPWAFKLQVVALVYLFTILLPTLIIHYYRKYQGWSLIELGVRERRLIPYVISIICYSTCYYVMRAVHLPGFMGRIIVAALLIQVLCAIINVWWKISTHTAAIGGVAGAVIAFSYIFMFNPVWWLCLIIFVAGLLGSSRMILRQHTLPQVVVGFFLGLITAFMAIV